MQYLLPGYESSWNNYWAVAVLCIYTYIYIYIYIHLSLKFPSALGVRGFLGLTGGGGEAQAGAWGAWGARAQDWAHVHGYAQVAISIYIYIYVQGSALSVIRWVAKISICDLMSLFNHLMPIVINRTC